MTIAWIDDDIDVLIDLLDPLKREPEVYQLRLCKGFNEARSAMREVLAADLVLLDILGPALGETRDRQERRPGLKFLEELRQKGFTNPVIVVTVLGEEDEIKTAVEAWGVDKIIRKAIRLSVLNLCSIVLARTRFWSIEFGGDDPLDVAIGSGDHAGYAVSVCQLLPWFATAEPEKIISHAPRIRLI